MKVHLFVGVPESFEPIGQTEVGETVIEIDLQYLLRVSVEAASRHVGEAVKLFLVFDGATAPESDNDEEIFIDGDNNSLLD